MFHISHCKLHRMILLVCTQYVIVVLFILHQCYTYAILFNSQVEKTFADITGDVYPVVVLGHKESNTVAKVYKL